MSYYSDGSVNVAASNVSFNKHYTWNKKLGVGSEKHNCV